MQSHYATEIHHDKVRANGIEMHYRFAGERGKGAPLVLLHGWPQHSLMWNRVMSELADRYFVIAPDLRGAGGSSITPGGYDKRTMARDVRSLLEQLNVGPLFLVGYDHGAGVAYQYAAAHPEDVRRLALAEYALPGFGYEAKLTPARDWDTASSWQLAFFTQPDIAETFIRGKERELLSLVFAVLLENVRQPRSDPRRRLRGICTPNHQTGRAARGARLLAYYGRRLARHG